MSLEDASCCHAVPTRPPPVVEVARRLEREDAQSVAVGADQNSRDSGGAHQAACRSRLGVPQFAKHAHSQTTSGSGHTWVRIALDTARVAEDIAIVVENKTTQSRRFRAALVGLAAQ